MASTLSSVSTSSPMSTFIPKFPAPSQLRILCRGLRLRTRSGHQRKRLLALATSHPRPQPYPQNRVQTPLPRPLACLHQAPGRTQGHGVAFAPGRGVSGACTISVDKASRTVRRWETSLSFACSPFPARGGPHPSRTTALAAVPLTLGPSLSSATAGEKDETLIGMSPASRPPFVSFVSSDMVSARAAADEAIVLARAAAVAAKTAAALVEGGASFPSSWLLGVIGHVSSYELPSVTQSQSREEGLPRALNLGLSLTGPSHRRRAEDAIVLRVNSEPSASRSSPQAADRDALDNGSLQQTKRRHRSSVKVRRVSTGKVSASSAVLTQVDAVAVSDSATSSADLAFSPEELGTTTPPPRMVRSKKRAERRVREQRRMQAATAAAAVKSASLDSQAGGISHVVSRLQPSGAIFAAAAGATGSRPSAASVPSSVTAAAAARASKKLNETAGGMRLQEMFEQFPELLTASQEVELAKGVQALLQLERCRDALREEQGREPTLEEWAQRAQLSGPRELEERLLRGRACKQRMVSCNMGLVVSVARKYTAWGLNVEDLVTVGSLGLVRAIEKFDFRRGFKFSTYAHWWIRQAVSRSVADQSRTVRLPLHVYEVMSRINKAREMLWRELGRCPMDEEVAELVGMSVGRLHKVTRSWRTPASMDKPIGSEGDDTLGSLLGDMSTHEAQEVDIERHLLRKDLQNALYTLSPRERDVMVMRFGLDEGQRPRTLEEIGAAFRVTRERIRQIEVKALWKLRQPDRSCVLREYMDAQQRGQEMFLDLVGRRRRRRRRTPAAAAEGGNEAVVTEGLIEAGADAGVAGA